MSMWRAWESYSPAMARRLITSRFSPSVIRTRSMYGSWLPAMSGQMLYGLRSSTQVGVLIGETVFHGVTTGRSGLRQASLKFLNIDTQLSNLRSAAFFSTSAFDVYFGRNCFR